jgi:Cu2+-exporting ATPase
MNHTSAHCGAPSSIDHQAMMMADFKQRFIISSLVSLPLVILSPFIQFPGDNLVWLALSTFIFFYGGKPFFTHGWSEIKNKRPGMMTLVVMAITVSYGYSVAIVLGLPGMSFFWELCTLIDVMLLGHWLEMRSIAGASKALEKLAQLLPAVAHVVNETGTKDVAIDAVQTGMIIIVLPGEKIPVDGKITKGQSAINQAMITGESVPLFKTIGDSVLAGSINGNGPLTVRVERTKGSTYIAQIIDLVQKVLASKSQMQGLADKAALFLTIIAIIAGFTTLIVWLMLGSVAFALERMVTVMVITCPHALGLAIPLVTMQLTTLAARNGLLIRNRTAFENARSIQTLIFDKTGTLTEGVFEITALVPFSGEAEDELLVQAASIESYAQHAIARALVQEAKKRILSLREVVNGVTVPGKGASGLIGDKELFLGNEMYMRDQGFDVHQDANLESKVQALMHEGNVVIYMANAQGIIAIIAAADRIREEAYAVCKQLKDMHIVVGMITGDNKNTAQAIARKLGIDQVLADVLPHQKAAEIEKLRKTGRIVAMVGDGINDAPALAAADIGIAIGAGTDVAVETADIILIHSNLLNVVDSILLSRLARRKMVENLLWATGYNIIAIPLAAGVLYSYGISISPAVGAFLMTASTLIVALNARFISYKSLTSRT